MIPSKRNIASNYTPIQYCCHLTHQLIQCTMYTEFNRVSLLLINKSISTDTIALVTVPEYITIRSWKADTSLPGKICHDMFPHDLDFFSSIKFRWYDRITQLISRYVIDSHIQHNWPCLKHIADFNNFFATTLKQTQLYWHLWNIPG